MQFLLTSTNSTCHESSPCILNSYFSISNFLKLLSTTLPKYLCGSNVWSEVYLWRLKYNFFHMLTLCLSTIICLIYYNYLCLSTIIFHINVVISYVLMQWWEVWFLVLPSGVTHGIFCMWTNWFSLWPTGSLCKMWRIMSALHPKYAVAYRRRRMIDGSSYKNHWLVFAQLPTHSEVLYKSYV